MRIGEREAGLVNPQKLLLGIHRNQIGSTYTEKIDPLRPVNRLNSTFNHRFIQNRQRIPDRLNIITRYVLHNRCNRIVRADLLIADDGRISGLQVPGYLHLQILIAFKPEGLAQPDDRRLTGTALHREICYGEMDHFVRILQDIRGNLVLRRT
ncbi:hypothetical protein D3C73_1061870 [compost metagenome]